MDTATDNTPPPSAPPPAPPVDGRLAWRSLASLAAGIEPCTGAADAVADLVPALLGAITTPEAAATPIAARTATAAEFAAAAARLHHVTERLLVAAVTLVAHESAHRVDHERTIRAWMARHCGVSHAAASMWCRVAEVCAEFPAIGAAFWGGAITAAHADSMSRIIPARFRGDTRADAVAKVRSIEDTIVETARQSSVGEFADFCARVRDRLDADGPGDPGAEPSKIWLHRLFNGRWSLSGDLSADDGAVLATILEDLRGRRTKQSDTSAEPSAGPSAEPSPEPSAEPTPAALAEARAADLRDLVLAGSGAGRPGRVGLFVHVDLEHLDATAHGGEPGIEGLLAGDRPAHTEAGLDVEDASLWALLAGADVTPIFHRSGRALSFGRTRRLAPDILRRVIAHRDQTCPVPGCTRPPIWNQAHHIHEWDAGGPTDPANMAGPCRLHHRQHHLGELVLGGDGETGLTVSAPDGTPIDPTPRYLRPPDRLRATDQLRAIA